MTILPKLFLAVLGLTPTWVSGADALGSLPSLPTGFNNPGDNQPNLFTDPPSDGSLSVRDFNLNLSVNASYDSNVTQGSDSGFFPAESDFIITTGLSGSYELGDSEWQLGGNASVNYREHFEREDFSALNYSFSLYGGYRSRKTTATVRAGLAQNNGVNLQTGQFLEQRNYNTSAMLRYQISGKTSLLGNWDYGFFDSQNANFNNAENWNLGLSALWNATPRITVGPGLRYGVRAGVGDSELTLLGLTMRLNYDLSTKVKLRSTIGLDRADSPFSGNDTLWNWSVGLSYTPSQRWGLNLDLIQDTQATFAVGGGFDQTASYQLNYWRKIKRARLSLGVSYLDRSPTDSLPTIVGIRDSQFISLTSSLGFPILADRANLSLTFSYREQETANGFQSWDGIQTGLNLSWRF